MQPIGCYFKDDMACWMATYSFRTLGGMGLSVIPLKAWAAREVKPPREVLAALLPKFLDMSTNLNLTTKSPGAPARAHNEQWSKS